MCTMSLEKKTALVTGASRGIGRAIAVQLAAEGAIVAIHYHRQRDEAEKTLENMTGGGHRIFQADISRKSDCRKLADAVWEKMDHVDILVNNAGQFLEHRILEAGPEAWDASWEQTLALNLLGPAHLSYWTARKMVKKGGGKIINISSRGAFRGEPDAPAYGASKAGLNAMSQSLAKALAPHNIFVYVVAPGWVETDMASDTLNRAAGDDIRAQSPLGRVAYPAEIAKTVAFLASEGVDFLTGCIIDVNGASYLRS